LKLLVLAKSNRSYVMVGRWVQVGVWARRNPLTGQLVFDRFQRIEYRVSEYAYETFLEKAYVPRFSLTAAGLWSVQYWLSD
jgi:hypothetical protein